MEGRIQKVLAALGAGSRRYCEELIAAGRVTVNGEVATVGMHVDDAQDSFAVDGVAIGGQPPATYLMLHKPRGYVTTAKDEKGRKTVLDLVADCPVRLVPVGRLDMYSEGLLLLTNDGELTNRLTHPRYEHEKEYLVWVQGDIDAALPLLSRPQEIDGVAMQAAGVKKKRAEILSMTLREGKNRQIRRMCEQAGLQVTRLKRVRVGALTLGELPLGKWRSLTESELAALTEK
jgi:pseudouridine synthase